MLGYGDCSPALAAPRAPASASARSAPAGGLARASGSRRAVARRAADPPLAGHRRGPAGERRGRRSARSRRRPLRGRRRWCGSTARHGGAARAGGRGAARAPRGAARGFERADAAAARREGIAPRDGRSGGAPPAERVEIRERGPPLPRRRRARPEDGLLPRPARRARPACRRSRAGAACSTSSPTPAASRWPRRAAARRRVTLVDSSGPALALAREHLEAQPRAGLRGASSSQADAFESRARRGERFDLLVVDPPPLARARSATCRAPRAPTRTCCCTRCAAPRRARSCWPSAARTTSGPSCSRKIAFGAALDAGRAVQVLRGSARRRTTRSRSTTRGRLPERLCSGVSAPRAEAVAATRSARARRIRRRARRGARGACGRAPRGAAPRAEASRRRGAPAATARSAGSSPATRPARRREHGRALGWLDELGARGARRVERAAASWLARRRRTAAGRSAGAEAASAERALAHGACSRGYLARSAVRAARAAGAPRGDLGARWSRRRACRRELPDDRRRTSRPSRRLPADARRRGRGAPVVRARARARLPHRRLRRAARSARCFARCDAHGAAGRAAPRATSSPARCCAEQARGRRLRAPGGARRRARARRSAGWSGSATSRSRAPRRRDALRRRCLRADAEPRRLHEAIAAARPRARVPGVPRPAAHAGATSPTAPAASPTCCRAPRPRLPPRARGARRTASRARTTSRSTSTTATSTSSRCSAPSRRAPCRSTSTTATSRRSCSTSSATPTRAPWSTTRASRRRWRASARPAAATCALWLQVADEIGRGAAARARSTTRRRSPRPRRAAARPLARRPLRALHRRHDGHAEGRALAPGGHLPRRARAARGRAGARRSRSSARAARPGPRALPAPPFMHGAAHWVAFSIWHVGRHGRRAVAARAPRPARHLVDGRARARRGADDRRRRLRAPAARRARASAATTSRRSGSSTSGGAILTAHRKAELLRRLPRVQHPRRARLLGERPAGARRCRAPAAPRRPATSRSPTTTRCSTTSSRACSRPGAARGLARAARRTCRSATTATPRRRRAPSRWWTACATRCPATAPVAEADGRLRLLGRARVTINTGGEKVFAEEVEQALKHHPAVHDAVVVGTPHERFGQQVTALVELRAGAAPARTRCARRCASTSRPTRCRALRLRAEDACARRAGRPTTAGPGARDRRCRRLSAERVAKARMRARVGAHVAAAVARLRAHVDARCRRRAGRTRTDDVVHEAEQARDLARLEDAVAASPAGGRTSATCQPKASAARRARSAPRPAAAATGSARDPGSRRAAAPRSRPGSSCRGPALPGRRARARRPAGRRGRW